MFNQANLIRGGCLFAVLGIGCAGSGCGSAHPAADTNQKIESIPVTVAPPTKGGVERTLTRPCSVHSFEYADLFAKVDGYLQNQTVDIGSKLKKNDVLAEIYAPERQTAVEGAMADLAKAKALVETKKAFRDAAEADLNQAKKKMETDMAQVEAAVATLALRKTQYKRIKRLVDEKALEQELADEKMDAQLAADAAERVSRKVVETDKVAIKASEAHLAVARADVVDAEAGVNVAKAALARAQVFFEYTRIRAPFDSVVTERSFHNGAFIQSTSSGGNKPLFSVARTDKMRVVVDVPEPFVPFTRPGRKVEVRVDALPGEPLTGSVSRIANSEDYSSRTMRTECDLRNTSGLLFNGMFGQMTLHLGKTEGGLSIPSSSFAGTGKNDTRPIFVVRDGKAHRIEIRIGTDDGIRAEVISGLKPDDQVILQHGPGLTDGAPVQTTAPKP